MTPRFESLQAPLDERRKLLEAAVDLYEFYHYHDMELNWINERLPIASSTNCGKSLDVAQSLLQKHKVSPFIKFMMACWHTAHHHSLQTSTCIILLYLQEGCYNQNLVQHSLKYDSSTLGQVSRVVWFAEQTRNSCRSCKIFRVLQYSYSEKDYSSSH